MDSNEKMTTLRLSEGTKARVMRFGAPGDSQEKRLMFALSLAERKAAEITAEFEAGKLKMGEEQLKREKTNNNI